MYSSRWGTTLDPPALDRATDHLLFVTALIVFCDWSQIKIPRYPIIMPKTICAIPDKPNYVFLHQFNTMSNCTPCIGCIACENCVAISIGACRGL